jgi:hypothetical protein
MVAGMASAFSGAPVLPRFAHFQSGPLAEPPNHGRNSPLGAPGGISFGNSKGPRIEPGALAQPLATGRVSR